MTHLHPSETGRIDRLPTWARDLIKRLDSRVDEAVEDRDAARALLEENTGIGLFGDATDQGVKIPRRKYAFVGERWTSDLRVRFENAASLDVTANSPLRVDVVAANVVRITERPL